jgi:hypothetical protein
MQSVLAQKIRIREISPDDSALVLRRFRADVRNRRFRVASLKAGHYQLAESLVISHGPSNGLRTLDSLHLALALDLHRGRRIHSIVAADRVLCKVAPLEGLVAIDPEEADEPPPGCPGTIR